MLCDGTKLAALEPAPADACIVVTLTLNGGQRSPVRPVRLLPVVCAPPYAIWGASIEGVVKEWDEPRLTPCPTAPPPYPALSGGPFLFLSVPRATIRASRCFFSITFCMSSLCLQSSSSVSVGGWKLPPPPDDVPVPPVPPVLLVVLVVLSICALLSELKFPADPPLPPPPLALNPRWLGLTACDCCSSPIVSVFVPPDESIFICSSMFMAGRLSKNRCSITESRSENVKSDSFSRFSLSSGWATSSISSSMNEASALHRFDTSCFTMSDGLATGSFSRRSICSSTIFASFSVSSENWFCVWQ
uniref:Uncharacterized protein n=1 Tax=Anopheles melas TaxID=34690 RepID=A0A182U6B0_9DIPT